jgi:SAM-dependent methyltransferase
LQESQPEQEAGDEERLERLFEPLREVLFKEMLRDAQSLLRPDFRLLDPASGAGAEAIELAMLLIEGEAVAVSRSSSFLAASFESARERGVGSLACFQAGPEGLPPGFAGAFDLVFSLRLLWLAPSKPAALGEVFRALRLGGYALLADLAPSHMAFQLPDPEAPRAEEEWSPQESGQELLAQMQAIGFSQAYWEEVLPGIGLILGMK